MFSVTNNRGFIPQSEQFEDREMKGEDIKAYKVIHHNDFAYNPARINVGSIAKYDGYEPCMISSLYVCFKANNEVDEDWLMHLLRTPKIQYYYQLNGEGGVRIYLFYPNFARIKTSIPSIEEQKKIAKVLSIIDERIATQNKIIEDLKKLKSAIIDGHFNGQKVNSRIGDLIHEVSNRNKKNTDLPVLSMSNRQGFIAQSEQFENRIIASDDTSNYKIVIKNDFAYNPARINVGSIARLVNYESGIVSPMYLCFRCSDEILPEYLELFFQSRYFQLEVAKRLEGSVRQCLSIDSIRSIQFELSPISEQDAFTDRLNILQSKINNEETISRLYQTQRKYLLTSMFI